MTSKRRFGMSIARKGGSFPEYAQFSQAVWIR
jgi:hypothetical protein